MVVVCDDSESFDHSVGGAESVVVNNNSRLNWTWKIEIK